MNPRIFLKHILPARKLHTPGAYLPTLDTISNCSTINDSPHKKETFDTLLKKKNKNHDIYKYFENLAKEKKYFEYFENLDKMNSLNEQEKQYLLRSIIIANWESVMYVSQHELNELQKDFKFVCNVVSQDYRSFRYVAKYFKDDEIAMTHLIKLNKNINELEI